MFGFYYTKAKRKKRTYKIANKYISNHRNAVKIQSRNGKGLEGGVSGDSPNEIPPDTNTHITTREAARRAATDREPTGEHSPPIKQEATAQSNK